jgi:hypothetical protein
VGSLGWCHPQRGHLAPEPFIKANELKLNYDPRFGTIIMFHVLSVVAVKYSIDVPPLPPPVLHQFVGESHVTLIEM